jgi:hypothetical protein
MYVSRASCLPGQRVRKWDKSGSFQPDLTKKDAQKSTARLPDPHPARRSDALF